MATTTSTLPQTITLGASDWATIALYLAVTAAIAIWVKLRERRGADEGSEAYFLAGRSQHWLVVVVTLFGATFSSISFVAIPGEAFGHGLIYSIGLLIVPFVVPVAIWLFLRFFFLTATFTSYEYLEHRFNAPMRIAGATIFTLYRLIYGGVAFYAASQLFEAIVGWPPRATILGAGAFVVCYTTLGGQRAVTATSFMQSVVRVAGIAAVLAGLAYATGGDVVGIYKYAAANDHTFGALARPEFYRPDLHTRYTVWLILYLAIAPALTDLSANQLTVQRLLTSKGYAGARRAALVAPLQAIPLVGMFWAVGIALFYFYGALHPDRLPPGIRADRVIGHFIATELPRPVPGLIVAAVLAALMGPIASVVNAVASVVYLDGLARLGLATPGSPREPLTCKLISVVAGCTSIGVALALLRAGESVSSSVIEISSIWGNLGYVLLAAFLLGVLAPRVSGGPMLVGCVVGAASSLILPKLLYYDVKPEERISFVWLGVPGLALALVLPLLLSLAWPQRKDLTNLTLWTIRKPLAEVG